MSFESSLTGDLVQVKYDEYSPWTGGKPLADWSGLDFDTTKPNPANKDHEQSSQLRPMKNSSGFDDRCAGFELKFKRSDDLYKFQRKLLDHFVTRGMDTITYLTDPSDSTEVINILTQHSRVTHEYVKQTAPLQAAKYDAYDCSNDRATRRCLLDSLEASLQSQVEDRIPDNATFLHVWMLLIQTVDTDSPSRFADFTHKIKTKLVPSAEAGQNISAMALKIMKTCQLLHEGKAFDFLLLGNILDNFLKADGNDEYRMVLVTKKLALTEALKKIRYMDSIQDKVDHLVARELWYPQLCDLAENQYLAAKADKKWPPQRNNPDSKAPPTQFQAHVAQVNALIQQMKDLNQKFDGEGKNNNNGKCDRSKDRCHLCGELGHWAPDCPQEETRKRKLQPKEEEARNKIPTVETGTTWSW